MKLIISGVPCCGKTYFGDWLRDNKGFAHVNLEAHDGFSQHVIGSNLQKAFAPWIASVSSNVVVTWGFLPNESCFGIIKGFMKNGFAAWWFDANHDVARKQYIERDGEEATCRFFDVQVQRLRDSRAAIDSLYNGRRVETLTDQGRMGVEQIFKHIQKVEQTGAA